MLETPWYIIVASKLHIVCNDSLYWLIKFIIEHFGCFTTNTINHTKIFSLKIMLLFIKGNNKIFYASKFIIYVVLLLQKHYYLRLKEESKLVLTPVKLFRFGHNSVHFNGSISWSNLPSSVKNNQALNELFLKLKNLGNIHCTSSMYHWDVLFYIFSFFVTYIFQAFIYFKFLNSAMFHEYQVDAS